MNRRLSLPGEEEDIPLPEIQPSEPVPAPNAAPNSTPDSATNANAPPPLIRNGSELPGYTKYAPGSRQEFIRDVNAYQAACMIHKTVDISAENVPIPSYDETDAAPPSSVQALGNSEFFRLRFLEVLSKLHSYLQTRKRKMTDATYVGVHFLALGLLGGGGAAWIVFVGSTLVIAFIAILGIVILSHLLYLFWKLYNKRKFFAAINTALERVEKFEKLDDSTVEHIKKGVYYVVSKDYWPAEGARARTDRPPRYEAVSSDRDRTAENTQAAQSV